MAKQQRQMEGDADQRRKAAREARAEGKCDAGTSGKPRPRSRDEDPKRADR